MSRRIYIYILCVFLFQLSQLSVIHVDSANAELFHSVQKYKNSEITRLEIQKVAQFDHLIRYFCGFSYFVPQHKVNPNFVRALILAESGANPQATSPKDALGLGQIIFPTGKIAARELAQSKTNFRYVSKQKLRHLKEKDLFDPAVNILLTCYLIAKYNHKFNGKLDLVISAWNAGENTKSLSAGRHAPFKETEDLIGKVNAFYVFLLRHRIFP